MNWLLILKYTYTMIDMNVAEYLSNIFLGQDSVMMSNFIYVIFPVLSITVLMFSLRSIVQDSYTQRMKKQWWFDKSNYFLEDWGKFI